MVTCLGELHIWTLKNQTIISDSDIGCFTYHDKGETVNKAEQPYLEEKQKYTESRDVTYTVKNKRPEKTRDNLKELEDILLSNKCIRCCWKSHRLIQAALSNGLIVYYILNDVTADVERVFLDKSLVGKLSGETANDVVVEGNFLAFSYMEKNKLDYVFLPKRPEDGPKKLEKLAVYDPKFLQLELPGPTGRRLERRLSCNINRDLLLVWWPTASAEAWPWAPMTSNKERANLVIVAVNGPKLDVLCYTRTDYDPIFSWFSDIQPHKVYTIEQTTGKDVSIETCTYETSRTTLPIKLQKTSVTSVPIKNGVISYGRNISEDKLLLGCADGTLVMYDEQRKITQMARANLTPSIIAWHPSGTLIIVASSRGEIQIFDVALSIVKFQLLSENPTPRTLLELGIYFRSPPTLGSLKCCPYDSTDTVLDCSCNILLAFDRGPFCMLNLKLGSSCITNEGLTPQLLLNQYIKYRQVDEAVNLLCALNWDIEGQTCLACIRTILDHLLRMPLSPQREVQLETALGTFYAPSRPLAEITVLEYRDPVSRYARRFFHHLLRYSRFEKAFLLAVDIGARDLFMDIHYLAQDKGELALADVSKQKADELEVDSLGTDTNSYEDELLSGNSSYSTESYEDLNMNGHVPPSVQQVAIPTGGRAPEMVAYHQTQLDREHSQAMERQRQNPLLSETANAVQLYHEEEVTYDGYRAALGDQPTHNQQGAASDDDNQVFYI